MGRGSRYSLVAVLWCALYAGCSGQGGNAADAAPAEARADLPADAPPPDLPVFEVAPGDDGMPDRISEVPDLAPDNVAVETTPSVTGCVSCHTNQPLLAELAPPEPVDTEEEGGG